MATTYKDLKANVQAWGKRTDSATISAIPQFIQAAQADFDAGLRIPQMITTKSYTAVDTIPIEFAQTETVIIGGSVALLVPLESVMLRRATKCTDASTPIYAVNGNNMILVAPDDVSVTGYLLPPRLSDSVQTNAYSTGAENAILLQSLYYLAVFARDAAAAKSWLAMATAEVEALNAAAEKFDSVTGVASMKHERYF